MALIYINFYISGDISNAGVRHRGQQSRTQEHRFDQSGHERKAKRGGGREAGGDGVAWRV